MHPDRPTWLWLLAAGLLSLIRLADAASPSTPNLLVNGDAELRNCTQDWTTQTSIPGWQVVRGAASVLCYSAFAAAHKRVLTPPAPDSGTAQFAAPGADTAIEQIVDVSPAASAIDHGKLGYQLSGWLGGWRNRPERATLTAN